jgi:hypothetical protein
VEWEDWKSGSSGFGDVQRGEIPADLPVKTTDDVDQGGGGGGGGGRKQAVTPIHLFVPSSRFGHGRLELFASLFFFCFRVVGCSFVLCCK